MVRKIALKGLKLLVLTGFFILITSCEKSENKIKGEYKSITESVYASISLTPDSLYKVYTAVSGIIDHVYIQEGDSVTTGEKLFKITNEIPQLNAENAHLEYQLALENYEGKAPLLNAIRDRVQMARLNFLQDSTDFYRQKRLWEQNIGTTITYEHKKKAYELSKQELEMQTNELIRTEIELKNKLLQAQNVYKNALTNANDYIITSKMDGKIYEIYKEAGELISPQEPLATVGSVSKFIVEMEVDEVDIVHISPGQKVLMSIDAYKDKVFESYISRILPQKDKRTRTFKVEARFKTKPDQLYAGLSGEANIVISVSDKTLVIPRSYLVGQNQVKTDNGLKMITIGRKNMEYVEVLSGIDSSTYLLQPE